VNEAWKEFGLHVQVLRIKKGISLREAARQLKLSPSYISKIENGLVPMPSSDVLAAMTRLYGAAAKPINFPADPPPWVVVVEMTRDGMASIEAAEVWYRVNSDYGRDYDFTAGTIGPWNFTGDATL